MTYYLGKTAWTEPCLHDILTLERLKAEIQVDSWNTELTLLLKPGFYFYDEKIPDFWNLRPHISNFNCLKICFNIDK